MLGGGYLGDADFGGYGDSAAVLAVVAPTASLTLSAAAPTVVKTGLALSAPAAALTLSAAAPRLPSLTPAPPTSVSRTTIEVLIKWGNTVGFTGPYDNVSKLVGQAQISVGRDDLLSTMLAGTATLTLRDADGLFNYANSLSPLYGQIQDRMHPISIRIAFNGAYRNRFYGLTRRIRWQPSGRKGEAVIECVDYFYWLQRAKPIIVGTGPTTTGAAIALILDAVSITGYNLDQGDDIPDFYADGSQTALELIQGLLEAERGVFYITGAGVPRYEDRHARYFRTTEATIVDRMSNLEPEVDFDQVRNRVRVTRIDPATGEAVWFAEAVDDISVGKVNFADADPIETPYLENNPQTDALAEWVLLVVADPTGPVRDLIVDGREPDLVNAILDLNLSDRVTLVEASGGTSGDFHIERHTLAVAPGGRISASYLVSRASTFKMLLVAANDADMGSGVLAADDSAVGAGILVY